MVSKEEKQMKKDLREAGITPGETSLTRQSLKTAGKIASRSVLKNPLLTPDKSKRIVKGTWKPTRPTTFDNTYSKEQKLLGDMFGGNRMMTAGDFKRPHLQGLLRKGGGILKNGDRGQTGRMFGIR